MAATVDPAILRPGDVVIYRPFELVGYVIALRTASWYSHVEVVEVPGHTTLTARADRGVDRYAWDWPCPGLALRPPAHFVLDTALAYFQSVRGQRYAFWSLLSFLAPDPVALVGQQFCSQFATNFYRAGGVTLFNADLAARVPPGAFATPPDGFTVLWADASRGRRR